jgi:hypothetical protein
MVSFKWVDAAGNIRTSTRDSPEGRAFAGGLGILGIMTGEAGGGQRAQEWIWGLGNSGGHRGGGGGAGWAAPP